MSVFSGSWRYSARKKRKTKQKSLWEQICWVMSRFKPTPDNKLVTREEYRHGNPILMTPDKSCGQPALTTATKLTSTCMTPDSSSAPKIISKEPITNRNTASAIALYGIFGGFFLNFRALFHKTLTPREEKKRKQQRKCHTAEFQVQNNLT